MTKQECERCGGVLEERSKAPASEKSPQLSELVCATCGLRVEKIKFSSRILRKGPDGAPQAG